MTFKTRFLGFWQESKINRVITLTLFLLLSMVFVFGVYYYADRYIHVRNNSPVINKRSELETLVRNNPNNPDFRINLAHYYYEELFFEKAKEQAEEILVAYPNHENALFLSGMANIKLNDTKNALSSLLQFVELRREKTMSHSDRYFESALFHIGLIYNQTEQPASAIPVFTQLLEINKMDADVMYQLGIAYAAVEQHQKAIEQFANAVRFVPNFSEAYAKMIISYSALEMESFVTYAEGMLAFSDGDYTQACGHLETAATLLENFEPIYLGLGLTYEKLGDFAAAQKNLERALAMNPQNYAASQALSRIKNIITNRDS